MTVLLHTHSNVYDRKIAWQRLQSTPIIRIPDISMGIPLSAPSSRVPIERPSIPAWIRYKDRPPGLDDMLMAEGDRTCISVHYQCAYNIRCVASQPSARRSAKFRVTTASVAMPCH